jgi:phospholipid/cholesterol/gamma-HCH transport system substrate-binding protein
MSSRSRNVKVGLFVVVGLVFSGLVIFLVGGERRLFDPSIQFRAEFKDVAGLKPSAPIRMGGIDIGHVGDVGYGKNPEDTKIYVTLKVVKSEASRIKTDSRVKVITKGLLGDKMIEISKGSEATLPPGSVIQLDPTKDVFEQASEVGKTAMGALDDVKSATANVQKMTETLANDKFQQDVQESVASVNQVLKDVAGGDGYAHRFLTDKAEADRISRTLDNLNRAIGELTTTLGEVRQIAARVKTGPGFAHDMVYGDGPQKQVEQFGNAAQEVATTLKGVRESDSLVHDALYGGKGNGAEALANVTAITGDLRVIMSNIRAGKGTMGALLVDPSLYEDMKVVLGNVQRNDVLRSLVRYSIKQDEKKPAVEVKAP